MKFLSKLVAVWHRLDDFQKARWKLTGFYLAVLFIILNIFTGSLFFILQREEQRHIDRVKTRWEQQIFFPGRNVTVIQLTQIPQGLGKEDFLALQHTLLTIIRQWILIIEGGLLFLAGVLSYFLSGYTLRPIQEKNRQQKYFLADVSHELKNPLSAIKMILEVSKKQKDWKRGEINEIFSDIDTEISRLIRLTEDLLFLEKASFSRHKKKQNVVPILNEVIDVCRPMAKSKNIRLVSRLEPFSTFLVKEDLEKVFFNLLHNAIKFSPPNTEVKIRLSEKGVLSVCDQGVGIPQKDLPKIFDRFYKVDYARSFDGESGSGLGLSIVKKICDKNNWKIKIESTLKKGTSVFVYL